MVGDLKNGRTVHSLVKLLSLYSVSLIFVAPPSLEMPESVKQEAERAGVPVLETTSLASVIGQTDVLYVTRVQQERFASQAEYEAVKDAYIVNNEVLSGAKEHTIVLHPLPRNQELDPDVDVRGLRFRSRYPRARLTFPVLLRHSTTAVGPSTSGRCATACMCAWACWPSSSARARTRRPVET